jgi:hypothetical protein
MMSEPTIDELERLVDQVFICMGIAGAESSAINDLRNARNANLARRRLV